MLPKEMLFTHLLTKTVEVGYIPERRPITRQIRTWKVWRLQNYLVLLEIEEGLASDPATRKRIIVSPTPRMI